MASIITYVEESYNELVNKVSWPTWAELQNSTWVVAVASIIIALMIFVMDFVFGITGSSGTEQEAGSLWRGILGFFYDLF
jgi:preprotein translocase subunit SecE